MEGRGIYSRLKIRQIYEARLEIIWEINKKDLKLLDVFSL